jgi:hypothetical protein
VVSAAGAAELVVAGGVAEAGGLVCAEPLDGRLSAVSVAESS